MPSREPSLSRLSELDDATILTPATPPESNIDDAELFNDRDSRISSATTTTCTPAAVPEPGNTFILRTIPSNRVLTLREGQVELSTSTSTSDYYSRESAHWVCIETKGYLGFRHVVSGKLLGYGKHGHLVCQVDRHREWESFNVRPKPSSKDRREGYVLLMSNYDCLWHVDVRKEAGVERLGRYGEGGVGGLVWEFIRVDSLIE